MYIEKLSDNRDKALFEDPDKALIFATKGIPKKHPFRYAALSIRALSYNPKRRPLSVTLPTSSMEQAGDMLKDEAARLEGILNSDIDAADKEIDANPNTIATIREQSHVIERHLGKTAVNL